MNPVHLHSLCHFTSRLIARYRTLDPENPALLSLIYAHGLLLKATSDPAGLPLQLAVIGPTQVGKSSLTNLLLGSDRASVSALAGHTRHAQGFSRMPLEARQRQRLDDLLPDLTPALPEQLFPDKVGYYSLIEVDDDSGNAGLPAWLVWDSPDFDSVSSRHYRTTVPVLCALADLVLVVVSKEKYADQSVWQLLRLLLPSGQPLALVVNKVPIGAAQELLDIIADKFREVGLNPPPLFALPYLVDPGRDLGPDPAAARLTAALATLLEAPAPPAAVPLAELLHEHWADWTAPVRQERDAAAAWQQRLIDELDAAEAQFERDYLQNTDYRESLDQAILQLLHLLEIPGLAAPLAKARELVTWPVRRAVALFQSQRKDRDERQSMEQKLLGEALDQAHQRLLHQVTQQASRESDRNRLWWQSLWSLLQQREASHRQLLPELIAQHRQAFEPEIERAASRLYQHLQQHPTTLNALRATRASADAAAVAIALKTGGIGLSDLLLTPAMLAVTSLLTEGAVGQFMEGIANDLRSAQRQSIQQRVLLPLRHHLADLPRHLPDELLFGIDPDLLQQAEQARTRLTDP